jgi:hypothetical protein
MQNYNSACGSAWVRSYTDRQTDRLETLLSYDTGHIENDASNNFSIVCIRYRGNVFIQPLPRNDTHTDTQTNERGLRSMTLRWAKLS